MSQENYIYRGVASFEAEGYGGRCDLGTPWLHSTQEVREHVARYFAAIPATWYINRETSGVAGRGVRNVEQINNIPEEHCHEGDYYILIHGPEETFIALGYSAEDLRAQVLSAEIGDDDVPFIIYHGSGALPVHAPRKVVDSFTRAELEQRGSAASKEK